MTPLPGFASFAEVSLVAEPYGPWEKEMRSDLESALEECDFDDLYGAVPQSLWPVMSLFSERAFSMAVDTEDSQWAAIGLVALYLAGADGRSRDSYLVLPLARRSCELLSIALEEVVSKAAEIGLGDHRERFEQFSLAQTPSPAKMGYVEHTGDAGPKFRRPRKSSLSQAEVAASLGVSIGEPSPGALPPDFKSDAAGTAARFGDSSF